MAKKIWLGILAMGLIFIFLTACGGSGSRINENNLVGVWELESAENITPFPKFEQFGDRTGIMYRSVSATTGIEFTWQLRDGYRLHVDSGGPGVPAQINDIELSERGTLLTFFYDGRNNTGENARIARYRKK